MDAISAQNLSVFYMCLCVFWGAPLIIGIIHYEIYGGDPMKRNLIDMLYSVGWAMTLSTNLFGNSVAMWILWVGPIWRWLAYVHYFIRLTNVFDNTMLVTETWIVRMSTEWIWKRPPTIHEDFFAIFIPALNIVLAVWFSWLQFLTGERGHQSIIRHTGSKDLDWPMADFTLNIDIMVIGLAGLSAIAYLVNEVAAKIKDHCCNNRNIDAVISLDPGFSDEDQGPEARWNNMAKNDQFVGTTMQLLAGITVIGGLVWAYQGLGLRRSDDNEQFQMWIMEVSIIQICFVPSLIFLKKSKLRKHFVTKIKHILRV